MKTGLVCWLFSSQYLYSLSVLFWLLYSNQDLEYKKYSVSSCLYLSLFWRHQGSRWTLIKYKYRKWGKTYCIAINLKQILYFWTRRNTIYNQAVIHWWFPLYAPLWKDGTLSVGLCTKYYLLSIFCMKVLNLGSGFPMEKYS